MSQHSSLWFIVAVDNHLGTKHRMNAIRVTAATLDRIGNARGAYVLVLHLPEPVAVILPGKAAAQLSAGWYFYAGNAHGPGGMASRLKRHMRREKKIHWHIDRLTTKADKVMAFAHEGGDECTLVARLLASGGYHIPLPGFGSSDCPTCQSHLLATSAQIPENGPTHLPIQA
ncbi:MAG: GIY-YIG nuclease family protein [Alphaproteobacteria bacterium]|nr:GIY-YIG nuclease family protein [Alphaproteobacteria bacterium]